MKRLIAAGFVLSVSILTGSTDFAAAQMTMAENTMFVAQLDAKQVVGGSAVEGDRDRRVPDRWKETDAGL